MKYIVTNIDLTTQKVTIDGQGILLDPGKSILMDKPPRTPSFRVEELAEELNIEQSPAEIVATENDIQGGLN